MTEPQAPPARRGFRKRRDLPKRRDRQTRYLSQAVQLEEAANPRIVGLTVTVISLAIFAFAAWAALTNVSEVARVTGEVVPEGFVQRVQHLEGGIVRAINVTDGAIVEAGDVLVMLDEATVRDDLESAQARRLALSLEAERLRAFIDGREPDFSRFAGAGRGAIADNRAFFADMREARRREETVIADQIEQRRRRAATLVGDLEVARANLALSQELFARRSELADKGHASLMQLLEDERRLNEARGKVRGTENAIAVTEREISEFENRRTSLLADQREDANEALFRLTAELDQTAEQIDKLNERIGRMTVRAPTHGLINSVAVNTIGAVVAPGDTLMQIVPLGTDLEAVVDIAPEDIGHLGVGQEVRVKLTTFNAAHYGVIAGKLAHISATTVAREDGTRVYQGRVRLDADHVGGREEHRILPGMTVSADILTGEKTVLDYLMRPIHASLTTALSER